MHQDDDFPAWPVILVAILIALVFLPLVLFHAVTMLLARIKQRARFSSLRSMAARCWARGRRPAEK